MNEKSRNGRLSGEKTLAKKEKAIIKFLLEEYTQCFNQMRHYDNIRISLMAFAFSFYASVGTAAFAIYQFFSEEKLSDSQRFLSLLSLFVFSIGLIIVFMLAKNRRYFVLVARQINGIRNTFFPKEWSDFKFRNFLPTDPDKPRKFDLKSTHLLSISLLSLLNSFAMFSAIYFLTSHLKIENQLWMALLCCLAAFISQLLYVKIVLKENNNT